MKKDINDICGEMVWNANAYEYYFKTEHEMLVWHVNQQQFLGAYNINSPHFHNLSEHVNQLYILIVFIIHTPIFIIQQFPLNTTGYMITPVLEMQNVYPFYITIPISIIDFIHTMTEFSFK